MKRREVPVVAEAGVGLLDLQGEARLERQEHRGFRCNRRAVDLRSCRGQGSPHRCDLLVATRHRAVVVEEPVPVLLGAEPGGAPAEEHHGVRAARHRLPGPERQFSRPGRHPDHLPARRARLLLHHPEAARLQAARRVVRQRQRGRIDLLDHPPLAARVVVPGGQIEIARDAVLVQRVGPEAHEVVGDEPARRTRPYDVELLALEICVQIGDEPPEVQREPRVRRAAARQRYRHVIPRPVEVAPERRAPAAVHLLEGSVPVRKPAAERGRAAGAEAAIAELIVDLPADHRGVCAVAVRHRRDDPPAMRAVTGVRWAVPPAVPVGDGLTGVRYPRHRAIGLHQPGRRRCRRRSQHDLQAAAGEQLHGPVEPAEVEDSLGVLQGAPGELSEAHAGEPGPDHEVGVERPAVLGPLLWVIVDTEVKHGVLRALVNSPGLPVGSPGFRSRRFLLPLHAHFFFFFIHVLPLERDPPGGTPPRSHPLIPLVAMPCTKYFWVNVKRITVGITAKVAPAICRA